MATELHNDRVDTISTIESTSHPIVKAWNEIEQEKRERIESMLTGGLSSTGSICAVGNYRLTSKCSPGNEGERIFHFEQIDLFGGRLVWSRLVNVEAMKVQFIYDCSYQDEYGSVIEIEK